MAFLKCKMCGGDLNIAEGVSVCECEYCGTKQTVPTADDEKKLNLFNRATRLRINGEFDKAAALYESLVAEFPEEAEAYWGLVICHYGIEYVDDPATGNKIPTCHRASFDHIAGDDNFRMAMEYADVMAQKVYRDEAREIDRIREEILSVCKDEKPYDIFICYKESDDKGGRTIDSVIAQDAYDALTAKGYRVFFARISLEDKLGSQYEPFIFSALNSARIMLVFGTKYEYFHAVWVKNEWSRFLKLMAKDKSKVLIPCYKDMDAYDMPDEFHALQAQDMGKVGAMQDLLRGIAKVMNAEKQAAPAVAEPVVTAVSAPTIAPLLERAFLFLEDGEWAKADALCEQVLNQNPKCGEAYLGKLMAEMHLRTREGLKECALPFDNYNNYQKAMRFGDANLQAELKGYIDHITERNRKAACDSAVAALETAHSEADYAMVADRLKALGNYADAAQLAEECREKAEIIRKDAVYQQAVTYASKQNDDSLQQAINLFASIGKWKDADARIRICQERLKRIQETKRLRAEAKEREAQRQAELRKKKARRNLWILGISIVVILVWTFAIRPWISYKNGNYRIYINRYNIEEFTIPDGVTKIEDGAFEDCGSLISVTIPDSVTSIGGRAFAGCGALEAVVIPDSVTSIGEDAFDDCTALREVTVNSQAVIDSGYFPISAPFESITIGGSVASISDYAFDGCTSLTSVTIGNSITSIGEDAFSYCDALTSVTIGNSITSIGDRAFCECKSLTSVTIPDSVTSIGIRAFADCSSLTSVTIPDSVTSIGIGAFADCSSLTSVEIPDSVTSIDDGAFNGCTSLTSVTIPDSVTTIGERAFYSCDSLTTVTIPDSVTSIGDWAFYSCDHLTDVYFAGSINQWNDLDLFVPFGRSVRVHCSDGTTHAY